MPTLFCYNHTPEPGLMQPDEASSSFYTCPICHSRVKVVLDQVVPAVEKSDSSHLEIVEEEAHIFLEEYIRRYQLANIDLFMELWSDHPIQSIMSEPGRIARVDKDLRAIRRSYEAAFRRMGRNTYHFTFTSGIPEDHNFRVNGAYRIEYPADSANPSLYEGKISLLLGRNFTGGLQILHLAFQPTTFF